MSPPNYNINFFNQVKKKKFKSVFFLLETILVKKDFIYLFKDIHKEAILFYLIEFHLMFFYMSKRIKSMTPSSLSPHYAAQSPSGRKPDLVAKEVLEWWQTNGKHPFIQPHISSPSNVGANSPENLPLGDKVQLIRLPVASPSAVKEFSQVSSEEPAHLTTETMPHDFSELTELASNNFHFPMLVAWKNLPATVARDASL
ncbi:hypothetical protein J3Q64DRAFT_1822212 [Phycomyces blakesleeanus]